jgi:large subunit ribosomal protein L21
MYAIIKTGGKQYRVQEGDVIQVESLGKEEGAEIEFAEILFISQSSENSKNHIGGPSVSGYVVQGKILGDSKGPKLKFKKFKPGNRCTTIGHRQHYQSIEITKVGAARGGKHGS